VFNGSVRLLRALPVLALSVVVLSGCGVAETQFHPGVAAQIGDETITSRHVDDLSEKYCTAVQKVSKDDPQASTQRRSMRAYSSEVLGNLVVQAVAERIAEDNDVTPSPAYKDDLAALAPLIEDLDPDEQDAVREIIGARSYNLDVLLQLGELELSEQGDDDASDDDKYAAGQDLVEQWATDHDVEINPKYVVDLGSEPVDNDLSVEASSTAGGEQPDEAEAAYAESLPDHLVCLG